MTYQLNDNMSLQFSLDARKYGSFTFKIEKAENGSFIASIQQDSNINESDSVGALYYVVAVIFIYGCSILMMIASYIRKNDNDRRLNRYLKEMATVRKRETQMQLLSATAKAANLSKKRSIKENIPKRNPSSIQSHRLSCVSEASKDFNTSDIEKEWESKHQYHLLTPTPSPGVTPGNSPSSISNSPVFTEFPQKVASKKKNPSVVRWVCETETETDSEFEHRLNDARNNRNCMYKAEGPSVIITPSNSPQCLRNGSPIFNMPPGGQDICSLSSREEESLCPDTHKPLGINMIREHQRDIDRLTVKCFMMSEGVRVSSV